MKQASRTHEKLRQAMVTYFSMREGVRQAPPEDEIVQRGAPVTEATFERQSDLRMDCERGLACGVISFEDKMISFASLTNGGDRNAREFVGRRWGMSAGRVNRISERTINSMVRHLSQRCPCR